MPLQRVRVFGSCVAGGLASAPRALPSSPSLAYACGADSHMDASPQEGEEEARYRGPSRLA
jgi:hypothetical protein